MKRRWRAGGRKVGIITTALSAPHAPDTSRSPEAQALK